MIHIEDNNHPTRMIFMGEAALTDGFKLIGFETWADPTQETLDQQLANLLRQREKAFIILGHKLASCDSLLLKRIRAEGGYIVITQIPSLSEPDNFQCEIDDRLQQLLGGELQYGQE
jgi:vacuolar-type H+-ATPase subunit F/Vma7